MKNLISVAVLSLLVITTGARALAHCQVPCGIYGDQRRFEAMLEDFETIAKSIDQIEQLAGKTDPLSHNQMARWVMTKEEHATNTQMVIANYFMAQRIKSSDQEGYVKKLTAAHTVMTAAMKCKQTADPASATALREAILNFYRAYEGREPELGDE